jgi:hypothetical protein
MRNVIWIISFILALVSSQLPANLTDSHYFEFWPSEGNETLGSLAQRFYGHKNMWKLLRSTNNLYNRIPSPDIALAVSIPKNTSIIVPPASECALSMGTKCYQILDYINKKNKEWLNDETVNFTNFLFSGTMEKTENTKGNLRNLELTLTTVTTMMSAAYYIIDTYFKTTKKNVVAIQIMNDTPDNIVGFTFAGLLGNAFALPSQISSTTTDTVYFGTNGLAAIQGCLLFNVITDVTNPFFICFRKPTDYAASLVACGLLDSSITTLLEAGDVDGIMAKSGSFGGNEGWQRPVIQNDYSVELMTVDTASYVHISVILYPKSESVFPEQGFDNGVTTISALYLKQQMRGTYLGDLTFSNEYFAFWDSWILRKNTKTGKYYYFIENRWYSLALTAVTPTTVQLSRIRKTSDPDYNQQLWKVIRRYDLLKDTWVLESVAYPHSYLIQEGSKWQLYYTPTDVIVSNMLLEILPPSLIMDSEEIFKNSQLFRLRPFGDDVNVMDIPFLEGVTEWFWVQIWKEDYIDNRAAGYKEWQTLQIINPVVCDNKPAFAFCTIQKSTQKKIYVGVIPLTSGAWALYSSSNAITTSEDFLWQYIEDPDYPGAGLYHFKSCSAKSYLKAPIKEGDSYSLTSEMSISTLHKFIPY